MFGFAHPVTTTVHTCTIVSGSLRSRILSYGYRTAEIALEEV
jgi:hypothetical protein